MVNRRGRTVEFHNRYESRFFLEDAEPYQNTSPDYRDFGEDDEDEDGDEGLTGRTLDIIELSRIIARRSWAGFAGGRGEARQDF